MIEQIQQGSQVSPKGWVTITKTNEAGQVTDQFEVPNLVVTTGKIYIAGKMIATNADVPVAMTHMALGSDNTAAAIGNTGLGTELGRAVLASATVSGAVVTYTATFGPTVATGAVVEAGIFNASSSGTMLCRTVFSVVNKGDDDTMSITWQITVS